MVHYVKGDIPKPKHSWKHFKSLLLILIADLHYIHGPLQPPCSQETPPQSDTPSKPSPEKKTHCKYRFKLNHYLCWLRTCITLFSLLSVTIKCLSVHYSQSLSKKHPLLVQIFQHSTFTSTNTYNLSQPESNWKVTITMLWIFQILKNNSNPISKHEKEETQP